MTLKLIKRAIRKAIDPLESAILAEDYFPLQKSLSYPDKAGLLWKSMQHRTHLKADSEYPEVTFLLYSKACERLLVPLIVSLLERSEVQDKVIQVNVIVLFGIHRLRLSPSNDQKLASLGCSIQTDYFSLIRACHQPEQKLVVVCLDQRRPYKYHFWGVDTVDILKRFGVKTLSIQHGGTRADSVEDLASAASDVVLVWGKRVYREIVEKYRGDRDRFRIVGNPLHDRLTALNADQSLKTLTQLYPELQTQLPQKRVILVATTLQLEYAEWPNEQALYRQYMQHIYSSIDFSKYVLLVKMHPLDSLSPNLYREAIPDSEMTSSVVVIEPSVTELDIYALLSISELLITRCSTVAEEALIMGRKVIAFDLMPEGPSKNYKHLEEYGDYTTVYQDCGNRLKETIDESMNRAVTEENDIDQQAVVHELTYRLDGKSAHRATDEILKQVLLVTRPEANQQDLIPSVSN
ncbi:MAG: hypothetical protein F6K42_16480 [Leptolyngbya sp. SIO1D8]|nr:hypothetical protein [Leptolyngbya sp. SIO1D8]